MLPPSWVCEELYKINSSARLAWAGATAKDADDLNAGSFALVKLYRTSEVGSLEEPHIIDELWNVTHRYDETGTMHTIKVDRGPIFNRHGGTRPDWDPLFWVPVFKVRWKDYGVSNEMIQSGKWLDTIREWMRPMRQRVQESAAAAGRDLVRRAEDHTREGYSILKREMNKPDAVSTPMAYKHCKADLDAFYKRKEANRQALLDYYNPEKVM